MANAQAQIALTTAAMPTATQIPTQVPTPIPTLPPTQAAVVAPPAQPVIAALPTQQIMPTATKKSGDPCNVSISGVKGPHTDVTFVAGINGEVNMYFYMYKTAFGCGFGNVNLVSQESATVSIPSGCYDFYGWVNGAAPSVSTGYACFQKDRPATVRINAKSIAAKLDNP
jgi:hypothetical protein